MMGGQITDIGNYEKYTKLDITFDKEIIAGWTGYQYEIDSQQQPEGNELLTSVLVKKVMIQTTIKKFLKKNYSK